MALPPTMDVATAVSGGETVVMRQNGIKFLFPLQMVMAFIRGSGLLGTLTVSEKVTVALPAQIRSLPVALAGLKQNTPVLFCPMSPLPAGISPVGASVPLDGTVNVQVMIPALSIGASYSITGKLYQMQ